MKKPEGQGTPDPADIQEKLNRIVDDAAQMKIDEWSSKRKMTLAVLREWGVTTPMFEKLYKVRRNELQWEREAAKPKEARRTSRSVEDYAAYINKHEYFYLRTGELQPAISVNTVLGDVPRDPDNLDKGFIPASQWLDINRSVDLTSWVPGAPQLIKDTLITKGGRRHEPGHMTFNQYLPPTLVPTPGDAGPWIELLRRVYPDGWRRIERFLAHAVQRPGVKINHALVLGGMQGIGKDTLLIPVKHAVGPWNFSVVSPADLMGKTNEFAKSVILLINEARDLGEFKRYEFYERVKAYTAAPPDTLRVNEKYLGEYFIPNVCNVIFTTNHRTDGLYLPAGDRRHDMLWSSLVKEDFEKDFWNRHYHWLESEGGIAIVAHHLANLDLSGFDPKVAPPLTAAFWQAVSAGEAPEDSDLSDALEALGRPDATTLGMIRAKTTSYDLRDMLSGSSQHARKVPYRMEACGYVRVRNPSQTDGRWKVSGRNVVIYAEDKLASDDQVKAARRLIAELHAEAAEGAKVGAELIENVHPFRGNGKATRPDQG